jgi:hypothetical protein
VLPVRSTVALQTYSPSFKRQIPIFSTQKCALKLLSGDFFPSFAARQGKNNRWVSVSLQWAASALDLSKVGNPE